MSQEEAQRVNVGDVVEYRGETYTVVSIRVSGIAAPYFRLNHGVGLVSHSLCNTARSLSNEG